MIVDLRVQTTEHDACSRLAGPGHQWLVRPELLLLLFLFMYRVSMFAHIFVPKVLNLLLLILLLLIYEYRQFNSFKWGLHLERFESTLLRSTG